MASVECKVRCPMDYVVGQMAARWRWQQLAPPLVTDEDLDYICRVPELSRVGLEWSRDHNIPFEQAALMLRHFLSIFGRNWSPVELRFVLDEALQEAEKMVMIDNRRK